MSFLAFHSVSAVMGFPAPSCGKAVIAAFALCAGAVIAPCSVLGQSSRSAKDAASLCDAYHANLRAIESFDVLFRIEVTWTGLDGGVKESISTIRLMWQADPERCLAVCRRTHAGVIDNAELPKVSQVTALVNDGERSYARRNQEEIVPFSFGAGRLLSTISGVPSIHFIGVTKFPTGFVPDDWAKIDHLFARLAPSPTRTFELANDSVVRVRDERLQSTDVINFDLSELVPRSIVGYFHPTSGDRFVRWRESYEFEERDEIRVPVKIVGEARKLKKIDGVRKRGHDLYVVDLTWVSVNESFDDRVFTRGQIENMSLALEMLSKL